MNTTTTARAAVSKTALNNKLEMQVNDLQTRRRNLVGQYMAEKQVEVSISPMYRPHFGNTMPVLVNGVGIYVPIDGQQYKVPETFAAIIKERISNIDEQLRIKTQMANVQANIESYAGEKGLLTKM